MFPPIEPYASGLLPVGDGNSIYWETSGNPAGRPALHLHGGPGGGMRSGYRRRFDPDRHLIVGFEQRGCGRSRPLATDDLSTLATNTTPRLVADIEVLRTYLGVHQWLVTGLSWGTTLGLAYAQAYPERVSGLILFATTLTSAEYVSWITETVGCLFPVEWAQFRAAADPRPGQSLVDAYYELLTHADPGVRTDAAVAWQRWEDTHISMVPNWTPKPGKDPVSRQVFATLVVHYWKHAAFLPDRALIDGMPRLAGIPGVLIQGKFDVSGPAATAFGLHRAWPGSRFVLIDDEGHGGPRMVAALVEAVVELGSG